MSTDTGGAADGAREPRRPDLYADDPAAASALDADAVHPEWVAVRPGVDYVPGTLEAEHVATVIRWVFREFLHERAALDRVAPMTDLDGRPYVRIDLGAAGARVVVGLLLDGLRFRGELVDRVA